MKRSTRRGLAITFILLAVAYFLLLLYADYMDWARLPEMVIGGALLFLALLFAEILLLPGIGTKAEEPSSAGAVAPAKSGGYSGVIEHLPPQEGMLTEEVERIEEKTTIEDVGEEEQAPALAEVHIQCPICNEEFIIENGKRPIRTHCPSCGAEGILR